MPIDVIAGYVRDADVLINRYNAVNPTDLYAPVIAHFPKRPSRILDIGAGTGRDAIWLNAAGHSVTAVEPVRAFRHAGAQSDPRREIQWFDGQLPELSCLNGNNAPFDLILLSAVWHHLDPKIHLKALLRISDLTAENGKVVMSLRYGATAKARTGFMVDINELKSYADKAGLFPVMGAQAASTQKENKASGVTWAWIVFQKR